MIALGGLSILARVVIAAVIVIVSIGGIAAYNESQKRKGEARVIERSKQQGEKINAKNEAVRRRAAEPGAFDRLLKFNCRDC